jgi:uncharacterized GH25 family protein
MRTLAALSFALVLATGASAHFVFIVPVPLHTVRFVFSDSLNPDENVPIEKISKTKAFLRVAGEKPIPLALEKVKDAAAYGTSSPLATGDVIYATTEFDVVAKGDAKPFLLRYHSKAVLGTLGKEVKLVGEPLPVELTAKTETGKLRFQFTAGGKPVAEAEVTVLAEGKSTKVTTDKEGWTPAQDAKPGQYGAWAKQVSAKSGEVNGKKYEDLREYATLVVEIGK